MPTIPIELVAQRFCSSLDGADWTGLSRLLAAHCEYRCRGQVSLGVETIVNSYRDIDEWVRRSFDAVQYESRIELQPPNQALITFRDQMSSGEHHLDFRCQQRISVDDTGQIVAIDHIDIDGEAEKAAEFNLACGVTRPGSAG